FHQLKKSADKFSVVSSALLRAEENYAEEAMFEFEEKNSQAEQLKMEEEQVIYALEHERHEQIRSKLARRYVDIVAWLERLKIEKGEAYNRVINAKNQLDKVSQEVTRLKAPIVMPEKLEKLDEVIIDEQMDKSQSEEVELATLYTMQSNMNEQTNGHAQDQEVEVNCEVIEAADDLKHNIQFLTKHNDCKVVLFEHISEHG